MLDDRTLVYSATREDGAGSGLWAMDVERKIAHPAELWPRGVHLHRGERGRPRMVATVANPARSLWKVAITDNIVGESGAMRLDNCLSVRAPPRVSVPTSSSIAHPREGRRDSGSSRTAQKRSSGRGLTELWAPRAAVSPDGTQISFVGRREGERACT